MATTTNYSWETPDDTDLVKDGAAAIRTLGSSIDSTVFANASAGIAKTIVDAKGDIIAATAADTVSRLAVGANNTVLTADSSTATGLKWAVPASGTTFSGCLLYVTYEAPFERFIADNTTTTLTWNNEAYDTDSYHSTSTNTSRITIPTGKSGYYQFYGSARMNRNGTAGYTAAMLKKNGGNFSPDIFDNDQDRPNSTIITNKFCTTAYLVAGDYVEMQVYTETQTAYIDYSAMYFGVNYLGA